MIIVQFHRSWISMIYREQKLSRRKKNDKISSCKTQDLTALLVTVFYGV